MSVFVKDIKKWRALQINEIWLFFADENYYIRNLKKGSTFEFQPILTDNDFGGQTIVGFKLTSKLIVIQNNYEELMPMLRRFTAHNFGGNHALTAPTFFAIELSNDKSFEDVDNDERIFFNIVSNNQTALVKDFNLTWSIAQNDIAPELTINIQGLFSRDIINLTNLPIFKQYDWINLS